MNLFELVSIQYQGDSRVRYYYAELKPFHFVLNDMQKKSIAWLLSELNECVIVQLRTWGRMAGMTRRFCVKNYINAGLSDNVRAVIIRRSRMRPRR